VVAVALGLPLRPEGIMIGEDGKGFACYWKEPDLTDHRSGLTSLRPSQDSARVIFRLPKRSEKLAQELPFRPFLLSPNLVSQNVDERYGDVSPIDFGFVASGFPTILPRFTVRPSSRSKHA